ncbi:MAG: sensor histidine kinase [Caulobacter sp.]|nr:sensor histidine kinase [Caulobacter sp.]
MNLPSSFRSIGFRLAASYMALFAVSVVVLGAVVFLIAHGAVEEQLEARIRSEVSALQSEARLSGLHAVLEEIGERTGGPGQLEYGVENPAGALVAGRLSAPGRKAGWATVPLRMRGGEVEPIRTHIVPLADGYRLLVGDELERVEEVDGAILQAFGSILLITLLLGAIGGYLLSRDLAGRIEAIARTAGAIIEGDLGQRIGHRAQGDDLDRLSATLNLMLDRIATLMDSLRQVSNDVAHDLRTPLTRLRQRLELAQTVEGEAERLGLVRMAIEDSDGLLETFSALLRIAQIEGGARRAGFRPINLKGLVTTVVDAYAPSAEDNGQSLTLAEPGAISLDGDPELLTQMIANLLANALAHAGAGARIAVNLQARPDAVAITVIDDGPGIPAVDRERVFDRFFRLEQSRTSAGNGLGLSLVRAIARLHGGEVLLYDAAPGLKVEILLPAG